MAVIPRLSVAPRFQQQEAYYTELIFSAAYTVPQSSAKKGI